jgi:dipeptidase E
MPPIRVLALSSSRVGNSGYLENAAPVIRKFLGNNPLNIAFIPFADADSNYDSYVAKVREGLKGLQHTISVVKPQDAQSTIEHADAIMVGGGNTFKLLHHLYEYKLMDTMNAKVRSGSPYIGWSAGSNVTGLTIGTTNDMPIIEPESFKALGFFPFQINPHYINVKPEGHNGETRDERLMEYLKVNPAATIVGLPEGTALLLHGQALRLIGEVAAMLFTSDPTNHEPIRSTVDAGSDISGLMQHEIL